MVKLYCHALAEVGLRAWHKRDSCSDSLVWVIWWPGEIETHKGGHLQSPTPHPSSVSQPSNLWNWQWAGSQINSPVSLVLLTSPQPNPLRQASLCFYSKLLCTLVTFSLYACEGPSPLKAITISPHHAVPSSSQTRHDRHINTPSHPIEHSVQKEEGNTMNVKECGHFKESARVKEDRICSRPAQTWGLT